MLEEVDVPCPCVTYAFQGSKLGTGYKKKTEHVREVDMVGEGLKVLAGKGELS